MFKNRDHFSNSMMKRSLIGAFWDSRCRVGFDLSCVFSTGQFGRGAQPDELDRLRITDNFMPTIQHSFVQTSSSLQNMMCAHRGLNSTTIYTTSCTHVALKRNVDVFTLTQQYHNLNKATCSRNQTWSCIVICCSDELKKYNTKTKSKLCSLKVHL